MLGFRVGCVVVYLFSVCAYFYCFDYCCGFVILLVWGLLVLRCVGWVDLLGL